MLPDGFKWADFGDVHRLRFGERSLALVTRLDDGRCRVTTNPDDNNRNTTFRGTHAAGIAYVEAWTCKWEARIREGGDHGPMLYGPGLMAVPSAGRCRRRTLSGAGLAEFPTRYGITAPNPAPVR